MQVSFISLFFFNVLAQVETKVPAGKNQEDSISQDSTSTEESDSFGNDDIDSTSTEESDSFGNDDIDGRKLWDSFEWGCSGGEAYFPHSGLNPYRLDSKVRIVRSPSDCENQCRADKRCTAYMTYRGGFSWYAAHATIYCFHYEVYEMIDSERVLGNYCKKQDTNHLKYWGTYRYAFKISKVRWAAQEATCIERRATKLGTSDDQQFLRNNVIHGLALRNSGGDASKVNSEIGRLQRQTNLGLLARGAKSCGFAVGTCAPKRTDSDNDNECYNASTEQDCAGQCKWLPITPAACKENGVNVKADAFKHDCWDPSVVEQMEQCLDRLVFDYPDQKVHGVPIGQLIMANLKKNYDQGASAGVEDFCEDRACSATNVCRSRSLAATDYSCSCDCYNGQCECTQNGERVESCDQSGRRQLSRTSSNYSCSCDCYNDQCECSENGERVESCDTSSQGGDWWNQDDEWQEDDGAWRRQLSRTSSNYSCSCDCYNDQCTCTENGEMVESCDFQGFQVHV
jgi:hypothetical protein